MEGSQVDGSVIYFFTSRNFPVSGKALVQQTCDSPLMGTLDIGDVLENLEATTYFSAV